MESRGLTIASALAVMVCTAVPVWTQSTSGRLIGAVVPVSTFFVFGILFLVVVNIYSTIKISTLTTQVKNLAQRLAIVDSYVQEVRHPASAGDGEAEADGDADADEGSEEGA